MAKKLFTVSLVHHMPHASHKFTVLLLASSRNGYFIDHFVLTHSTNSLMQLSLNSGLAVTTLWSNKAHAFAGLCPDTCKFIQTHANTSLFFIVSGCWQVCKYDVVRSNSKTAEMRSVKVEISAFLRNFCSSLLNNCLNSPGLGVWQVL